MKPRLTAARVGQRLRLAFKAIPVEESLPKDDSLVNLYEDYQQIVKDRNLLEKHPRFHLHFTPTSSSWLNLIERWFAELTNKAIRRGAFVSVDDLVCAINEFVQSHNADPKPFVWTASVDQILTKVGKCKAILATEH